MKMTDGELIDALLSDATVKAVHEHAVNACNTASALQQALGLPYCPSGLMGLRELLPKIGEVQSLLRLAAERIAERASVEPKGDAT